MEKNLKHSGTRSTEVCQREIDHAVFAREAAEEGIVLLKNEGLLPLKKDTKIALLGIGAEKTIKGGTGSGDVNNRESVSIYAGMKEKNAGIVSEEWLKDYHNRYEQARAEWKEQILEAAKHVDNPFDAYAANPFAMPDGRAVTNEDIKAAEAAVYVISRISGEGKDRRKRKGDYYLSDQEEKDLYFLNEQKIPTVLIINAGGPVELTDLLAGTENICAILNISQLGQEGGNAVADILFGEFTPSGKLTTTWTKRYDDCPAAEEFSYLNGNLETEEYAEGIYVGYRYFDSFGIEPLFSFGYGLSYTEFDIRLCGINTDSKGVTVTVEVENTGTTYSGKEVVQIYASLPQDGSRKEFRRLVGYEKTEELKPGEKEMLNIVLPAKAFASFLEEQQEWRIQAGAYGIWIGNSLSEAKLSAGVKVSADVMMEKTKKLEDHSEVVEIKDCAEELCRRAEEWTALLEELPNVSFEPEAEEKKVCRLPEETEIPVEDLIPLMYGNMSEIRSTLGASGIKVPGTAGETSEALLDQYGIPSLIMADGPAGIRLQQTYEVDREKDTVYGTGVLGSLENGYLVGRKDHEGAERYYQYCTAFPVGTALAQSWNKKLMEQFGRKVAAEMEEFHINLWLAPGLNIHRNPLCGRNFEYYSEDPFLAGTLAAAVTRGVQSRPGCGVTIKHFACNNQEDNRMGVDAHISERTLREIYLRGFEIAVKEGAPTAIMSSYNLINGVHAANSKDLCTRIAREEWGFDGVIMSDWNTTVPEDGSIPWVCVAAGNDIIMPGNPDDDKNIRDAYKEGKLKAIGVSNFYAHVLVNFVNTVEIKPMVNQVELHPYYTQEKAIETMKYYDVIPEAWAPLGGGRYKPFEDEMLKGIAAKYNKSVGQVLLRWNVQRGVVVVPKSTHVERIKENIDIFDFELNEEEMKQISLLDMGYSGSRAKHFELDFVRIK